MSGLMVCVPGSEVFIGDIKATVNQVCIHYGEQVTYEVFYWVGTERKTVWVNPEEISKTSHMKTVGFVGV